MSSLPGRRIQAAFPVLYKENKENIMSISINTLTFTGRVGAIFGIKKYNNGSVLEFSVGVRPNFKNKNGEYDTQWYFCKVWDKPECSFINTLASQIVKGAFVTCSGQLEYDPATGGPRLFTGNDGVWRAVFGVNCRDVVVQSPRPQKNSAMGSEKPVPGNEKSESDMFNDADNIPW